MSTVGCGRSGAELSLDLLAVGASILRNPESSYGVGRGGEPCATTVTPSNERRTSMDRHLLDGEDEYTQDNEQRNIDGEPFYPIEEQCPPP